RVTGERRSVRRIEQIDGGRALCQGDRACRHRGRCRKETLEHLFLSYEGCCWRDAWPARPTPSISYLERLHPIRRHPSRLISTWFGYFSLIFQNVPGKRDLRSEM